MIQLYIGIIPLYIHNRSRLVWWLVALIQPRSSLRMMFLQTWCRKNHTKKTLIIPPWPYEKWGNNGGLRGLWGLIPLCFNDPNIPSLLVQSDWSPPDMFLVDEKSVIMKLSCCWNIIFGFLKKIQMVIQWHWFLLGALEHEWMMNFHSGIS